MKPGDLARVIVDADSAAEEHHLPDRCQVVVNRAREKLVKLAKKLGVELRQSYARVGKFTLIKHQRYAHARQFNRAKRALRKLKTYLGRVIRDIARKIEGDPWLGDQIRSAAEPGTAGARSRSAGSAAQGLQPPRSRGRVHRQGQSPQAL